MQDAEKIRTDNDVLWSLEWIANARPHHDIICDYLQWKLKGKILDIGERNPLTVRLEGRNGVNIDHTTTDLDKCLEITGDRESYYNTVIMSHVIEHLFNPLSALWAIKQTMRDDGLLYIIAPIKPYWITPAKCHFHEMDDSSFVKLITEAGFIVVKWDRYSVPIPFRFSLRNWLRRFYKEYSIVTLKKA